MERPHEEHVQVITDLEPQTETSHRWRKIVTYGAGVLAGAVIGAGVATDVLPDHVTIGPVQASVRIVPSNVNSQYLIGKKTLRFKEPSPLKVVGAEMHITDLNTDLGSLTDGSSSSVKDTESSAFAQTFTNVDRDKSLAEHKVERRLVEGALGGALLALALEAGIPYYRRRLDKNYPQVQTSWNTLYQHYSPALRRTAVVAGVAIVAGSGLYMAQNETQSVHPSKAFSSIEPLRYAEATGTLAPTVSSIITRISSIVTENQVFYRGEVQSADAQFTPDYAVQLPDSKGILPILLYTDRHCNVGMDQVLSGEAKLYHVKLAISGGDDDFSGTYPFEFACTSELASYFKSMGIAEVNELGNHDSSKSTDPDQSFNTEDWEKSEGIHVLDGKTLTIHLPGGAKITILGSRDPRRSRLGHKIVTIDGLSQTAAVTEQGEELAKTACASSAPIDILVTHDPTAALTAVQDGCENITFTFSGHTHVRSGPTADGYNSLGQPVFRFTGGTTGGAKEDTPTFGPLQAPGTSDILYWDTQTNQPIGIVGNQALPDGSMSLGNYIPLNTVSFKSQNARAQNLPKPNKKRAIVADRGSVRNRGH